MIKYSAKGNCYTVVKCTIDDIDRDYELVRKDVDDCPEEDYKDAMRKSVESGVAYRSTDKDGKIAFLYTYIEDGYGRGASIYNGGSPIGLLCVLKTLGEGYPSHVVTMYPHKGNVGYIRSLVLGYSMRNWHNGNGPLVIKIDELRPKIDKLWAALGVK